METETEKKAKNVFIPICITQVFCISIILIVVLIIKFFFGSTFEKIEKWHDKYFLEETTITANFDEEKT